jgi:FHA domain
MGMTVNLLEELKRQADKRRIDQEQTDEANNSLHALRCMKTVSALQQIHQYLHELVELLNEVKPDTKVNLQLETLGKLEDLTQSEYRLYQETSQSKEIVRLVFVLQSEKLMEITSEDSPTRQLQLERCKKQGLIVSYVSRTPPSINIQGYVPVAIEFHSDFVESNIHVVMQNFTKIADQHCLLNSDNVNEDTLEQLGNFLLRRPNKFLDLLAEDTLASSGTAGSGQYATKTQPRSPQTEELEISRLRKIFNSEQRLYLTYHNNIRDLGTRTNKFIIGRAKDADFVIKSDLASRHHAVIAYRNGKFVIIDQSTNGTFVKSQGGKEVYVHAEQVPLTGSGFISLGKSITVDNENLIYFSCQ